MHLHEGFMELNVKEGRDFLKARMGRNPQTGEAIKIPANRVLKIRVARAAKDAVLGGK